MYLLRFLCLILNFLMIWIIWCDKKQKQNQSVGGQKHFYCSYLHNKLTEIKLNFNIVDFPEKGNGPKHTSQLALKWIKRDNIKLLEWPQLNHLIKFGTYWKFKAVLENPNDSVRFKLRILMGAVFSSVFTVQLVGASWEEF